MILRLDWLGYRHYAPVLGKWITRDPTEEGGGYNLYAYVSNNPIMFSDPLGLFFPIGGPGFTNVMHSKPPSWSEQSNNFPSPVQGAAEGVNMHNAIPGQFAILAVNNK